VDEIVGALVEQLAKRAREQAARRAQAAAGAPGAPPRPPVRAAAAPPAPGIVTPRRDVPRAVPVPGAVAAPSAAAPAAAPRPAPPAAPADIFGAPSQDIGFGDPFGLAAVASAPVAAVPMQTDATSFLLRAFAGGQPLLAGIVLSEALAPPVALRSTPPV
jgi:hypothetical protein